MMHLHITFTISYKQMCSRYIGLHRYIELKWEDNSMALCALGTLPASGLHCSIISMTEMTLSLELGEYRHWTSESRNNNKKT